MKENRKVGELLYSDTILSGFVAIGPCRLLADLLTACASVKLET